jgi:PhnB protein
MVIDQGKQLIGHGHDTNDLQPGAPGHPSDPAITPAPDERHANFTALSHPAVTIGASPVLTLSNTARTIPGGTMSSQLNPYLNFNGTTRQALEFYASVFGGDLTLSTFGSMGMEGPDSEKIMHGALVTDAGYTIMAADVPAHMEYAPPAGFAVSISGDDGDALRGYFEQLAAGGTTEMPLQKQAWGDEFGMCTDSFGIQWMVDVTAPEA